MKRFVGFVRKEFIHIFRDRRTLLILFGMPIAQILIFGYVVTNEIKEARIAIYDQSKDAVTREITDKILSSGYFRLARHIESDRQIKETFQKGEVREIIVFEPNFDEKLTRQKSAQVQILLDATDANMANLLQSYTAGIISDYSRNIRMSHTQSPVIRPAPRML